MPKGEHKNTYIYGLVDPDDFKIRYIGQSVDPIHRLGGHLAECLEHMDTPKHNWFKELIKSKKRPYIMIFERVSLKNAQVKETEYISRFSKTVFNTHKEVKFMPANTNKKYVGMAKMFIKQNTWLKGMDVGWGNGYVIIPEGHPFYGKDYDDIDVNVHGGLTFSEFGYKLDWEEIKPEDKRSWVVGFDTAHWGDNHSNWTRDRVVDETIELQRQINNKKR